MTAVTDGVRNYDLVLWRGDLSTTEIVKGLENSHSPVVPFAEDVSMAVATPRPLPDNETSCSASG